MQKKIFWSCSYANTIKVWLRTTKLLFFGEDEECLNLGTIILTLKILTDSASKFVKECKQRKFKVRMLMPRLRHYHPDFQTFKRLCVTMKKVFNLNRCWKDLNFEAFVGPVAQWLQRLPSTLTTRVRFRPVLGITWRSWLVFYCFTPIFCPIIVK